jgi:hypothetical protein
MIGELDIYIKTKQVKKVLKDTLNFISYMSYRNLSA